MAKTVLSVIILLAVAAPCGVAQGLSMGQQVNITVHVAGVFGLQMPDIPTDCSDCTIRVRLSAKRPPAKASIPKTIVLARLASFEPNGETAAVIQQTFQTGAGSYAIVHVRRGREAQRSLLTIELQQY